MCFIPRRLAHHQNACCLLKFSASMSKHSSLGISQQLLRLLLVDRPSACIVPRLRREVTRDADIRNTAQQGFHHSVSSAWGIPWQLMSGELNLVEGESALSAP